MPRDKLLLKGVLCGAAVALSPTLADEEKPVWIQIAREGVFKGHPDHPQGVHFTRELFSGVIANLRALPEYTPGPDGVGTAPVVPYDYEHASEMDPTRGSIPQTGAPAPAWVLDLKIVDGNQGAELWALSELGEKAREQIRTKEYRWTSVAIHQNMRHPETNQPIGPYLSSVAFTNHPFLRAMAPMAARAFVTEAESPEEALVGLRELFELEANAAPGVVAQELDQLRQMLASGIEPDGVDLPYLIAEMRSLLGLRRLATRDEVLAAAGQILTGILDASQTPEESAQEPGTMPEPNALTAKLASILKVNPHDELVLAAAEKAVDDAKESQTALDQFMALFDSKDFTDLMSKASETIKKAAEAEPLVAALAEAKKRLGKVDDAEAEAEAEAVVASMKLDADTAKRIKPIILDARKACIGDDDKLTAFRKRYPLPEADRVLLTQRVFAGPNGTQTTIDGQPAPAPAPSASQGDDRLVKLRGFAGRNTTEKAMALLTKEEPGFENLDRFAQVKRAGQWLRGE